MRNYVYYIIGILLICACSKDEIDTFETEQQYLFFGRSYADSLTYSFFYYPDSTSLTIPVEVKLVGNTSDKDREFKLAVDTKESTVSDNHYTFPEKFIFRANHVADTVYIKINNAADLREKMVRLVLKVESTALFLPGQSEYTRNILRFSDIIAQPEWWDQDIIDHYLGEYTETKFREFMKVTGQGDLSDTSPDELWYLARSFKYYLQEMEKAGTPVIDEGGGYMSVPVIG